MEKTHNAYSILAPTATTRYRPLYSPLSDSLTALLPLYLFCTMHLKELVNLRPKFRAARTAPMLPPMHYKSSDRLGAPRNVNENLSSKTFLESFRMMWPITSSSSGANALLTCYMLHHKQSGRKTGFKKLKSGQWIAIGFKNLLTSSKSYSAYTASACK